MRRYISVILTLLLLLTVSACGNDAESYVFSGKTIIPFCTSGSKQRTGMEK